MDLLPLDMPASMKGKLDILMSLKDLAGGGRQGGQEGAGPGDRAARRRRRARHAAGPQDLARGRRAGSSRCRSWSRATRRASSTSACTGCRSSTATRPACTSTSTTTARGTCARGRRPGSTRVPVSVALGGDPVTIFSATAPVPPMIDEYLFSGILRGEPVEVVKCVTNDLLVPAHAEIVLEGWVRPGRDPLGGAVRRSHRLLLARRLLPGLPRRGHHDAQGRHLPGDDRRAAADGGRLPRQGDRAAVPAGHQGA